MDPVSASPTWSTAILNSIGATRAEVNDVWRFYDDVYADVQWFR